MHIFDVSVHVCIFFKLLVRWKLLQIGKETILIYGPLDFNDTEEYLKLSHSC